MEDSAFQDVFSQKGNKPESFLETTEIGTDTEVMREFLKTTEESSTYDLSCEILTTQSEEKFKEIDGWDSSELLKLTEEDQGGKKKEPNYVIIEEEEDEENDILVGGTQTFDTVDENFQGGNKYGVLEEIMMTCVGFLAYHKPDGIISSTDLKELASSLVTDLDKPVFFQAKCPKIPLYASFIALLNLENFSKMQLLKMRCLTDAIIKLRKKSAKKHKKKKVSLNRSEENKQCTHAVIIEAFDILLVNINSELEKDSQSRITKIDEKLITHLTQSMSIKKGTNEDLEHKRIKYLLKRALDENAGNPKLGACLEKD